MRFITKSWAGWCEAGHVDRVGREVVATEFFRIFIPLWPRAHSMYLFHDSDGRETFLEIPRDRRSLALGYLRTPVWLAATILGAGGLARDRWSLIAIAAALAVLGYVLTFRLGTLPVAERERRELLQRVTGLGAPPELMSASMRGNARDGLAGAWYREHGVSWQAAILDGVASEVLVAIAEYDRSPKFMIRARTNLIDAEGN